MANKAISELPQALNVNNQDLFVLEQSGIAKKLTAETFITEQGIIDALAEALDGHGGISSVTLSSVSGRIRTYLITFTDGSATTFQVYDGTTIERIAKTSTAGLVDTYTVFMSDGTTSFFQVTNGSKGDIGYPTDEQVATAVDAWLDDNVTQETGYVLDRTLSMSNAAAPADLVGELKSALIDSYNEASKWVNGYWAIVNGTAATGTNDWIRTIDNIPDTVIRIYNNTTLLMYLQAWDKETGTYIGTWNGSAFTKTYIANTGVTDINMKAFRQSYPNYKWQISIKDATGRDLHAGVDGALVYFSTEKYDAILEQVNNYIQIPNIEIVNHRGYESAPENTIPAFKRSAQYGYKWVESDVLFTSDGVPVMLHDASINRTARNADGTAISGTVNIADITYAQALTYDFGIYKGPEYAGTKIPTLEQFIQTCKSFGLSAYIELKDEKTYTQAEVDTILSIIQNNGMRSKVKFISFSADALGLIKNRWDEVPLGLNGLLSDCLNLKTEKNTVFCVRNKNHQSDINPWIQANIPVCVYIVDTTSDFQALNPYYTAILTNKLLPNSAYGKLYSE